MANLRSVLLMVGMAVLPGVLSGCVSAARMALTPGATQNSLGLGYAEQGRYDEAIASFDSAIRSDPKQPLFYLNRGVTYADKGDFDRAIEDHSRAISLKPDFAAAFIDRGTVYLRKGDFEQAIRDFDEAIRLKPDLYPAFVDRGRTYFAKKDYERGKADLEHALELGSSPAFHLFPSDANERTTWSAKSAMIHSSDCEVRAILGKELYTALDDCSEALRQRPKSAATLELRAFVYLRLQQYDDAVADASRAIALEPRIAQSFYIRGVAKRRLGDVPASDQDLDRARGIDPGIDGLYRALGVQP